MKKENPYYFVEYIGKDNEITVHIISSDSLKKVFKFIRKKYGKNIKISDSCLEREINYVGWHKIGKVDFEKSDTIQEIEKAKLPNKFLPMQTKKGYFYTSKKNTYIGGDIILRLVKEKLNLPDNAKAIFVERTGEGKHFGNIEWESGKIITSNSYYIDYWLEFDEKKGFYLDPCEIIKITEL